MRAERISALISLGCGKLDHKAHKADRRRDSRDYQADYKPRVIHLPKIATYRNDRKNTAKETDQKKIMFFHHTPHILDKRKITTHGADASTAASVAIIATIICLSFITFFIFFPTL